LNRCFVILHLWCTPRYAESTLGRIVIMCITVVVTILHNHINCHPRYFINCYHQVPLNQKHLKVNIIDTLICLSVGIENVELIIQDIRMALLGMIISLNLYCIAPLLFILSPFQFHLFSIDVEAFSMQAVAKRS
jgi:hypothetical protein